MVWAVSSSSRFPRTVVVYLLVPHLPAHVKHDYNAVRVVRHDYNTVRVEGMITIRLGFAMVYCMIHVRKCMCLSFYYLYL